MSIYMTTQGHAETASYSFIVKISVHTTLMVCYMTLWEC